MESIQYKFVASVAAMLWLQAAAAAPLLVKNPGFESPIAPVSPGYTSINGQVSWAYPAFPNIYVIRNSSAGITNGASGIQSLLLEPYASSGDFVRQTLTNKLQAGTYKLTVAAGYNTVINFDQLANAVFSLQSYNGISYSELASYTVTAGIMASKVGVLSEYTLTLTIATNNPHLGENLVIKLASNTGGGTYQAVSYDNVRLDWAQDIAPIAVGNASFESPSVGNSYTAIANQSNWAWNDGNIYVVNKAWAGLTGSDGPQALLLEPYAMGGNLQYVWQILTNQLQVGSYLLTASVGYAKNQFCVSEDAAAVMRLLSYNAATGSYTELASTTIPAGSLRRNPGNMTDNYLTLDVPSGYENLGQSLVVSLGATGSESVQNVSYDNVRLSFASGPPSPVGSYTDWAAGNAGGQAADLDYNIDGVSNGMEYFLAKTSPTFTLISTPLPTVTWLRDPLAIASFNLQVSDNLTMWTNVPSGDSRVSITASSVSFTFNPSSGPSKQFIRLQVTP